MPVFSLIAADLAPAGIAFVARIYLYNLPFFDEERNLYGQVRFQLSGFLDITGSVAPNAFGRLDNFELYR